MGDEVDHDALELVFTHLAVADRDAGFGYEPGHEVSHREDGLDPVVHEVHLAAAFQLRANRPLDHGRVELEHVGLDRQSILRRRLDDRHVADARKRHVQRARNGRGRHGEHVHSLSHLLDALLVRDAEPLLLVDDEKAEVAELQVLREQPMRADDDLHLPGGRIVDDLLLFGLRPEAADHLDPDGESGEPIAERLLVLEGEDRRRREERDLLAVHHRLERGAHRDLGLAVSDVAAEQSIHRRRRLHVAS